MYSTDNKDGFMAMAEYFGGDRPHFILNKPALRDGATMWNIEGINPYIEAFSPVYLTDGLATDLVTCPSCSGDFMQDWIHDRNWKVYPFAEIAYSYFGRADLLDDAECSPNAKKVLVGKTMTANKLLMSEILNLDTSDQIYRFNHGRTGWSWNQGNYRNPSNPVPVGKANATGRSQLFGDGHVEWRKILIEKNLPTKSGTGAADWNGEGSGWIATYDTVFF
jgi:hypothetical protein